MPVIAPQRPAKLGCGKLRPAPGDELPSVDGGGVHAVSRPPRFAAGSVVVAGVAGEDDHPAVGRGGGLLDQALVG
jgi:hypothetical protein